MVVLCSLLPISFDVALLLLMTLPRCVKSSSDDDGGDNANDEDEKVNLLILVFFQNPVGVEHPSILHIFDIWTGGGGL